MIDVAKNVKLRPYPYTPLLQRGENSTMLFEHVCHPYLGSPSIGGS